MLQSCDALAPCPGVSVLDGYVLPRVDESLRTADLAEVRIHVAKAAEGWVLAPIGISRAHRLETAAYESCDTLFVFQRLPRR